MNVQLFLALFSVLGVVYLILGLIASKNIKTTTDYFLAGRNLGVLPITFTLIATQLGGGMLLGTSNDAYRFGYYGILYTVGMSLGFILLGLGFASKLQSLKVSTTAELFETRYGSSTLKKVASLFSIVSLCGLLVGQIVAARGLIAGLGIGGETVLILFWLGVIAYTMVGGLKAVVYTDTFQVGLIILIFSSIFVYILMLEPSSFFSFSAMAKTQTTFFSGVNISTLISVALMPALFALIEQDLAQRFFAARTKRIAAISAISASIFMIIFSLVPIYFGIKAKTLGLVFEGWPLIPTISHYAGDLVLALAACAIVAAITSTADSLLCAISSNVSEDFGSLFSKIKNKLTLSKVTTLITGIIAIIASYFVPQDIITVLKGSYELSVSCLLVPLLVSYFKKGLNKNAAIGSIVLGLAGFITLRILPSGLPALSAFFSNYPLIFQSGATTLMLSVIGYLIGNTIGKKQASPHLER